MIRRNTKFTVTADGRVTPAVAQYGGVKGEHNATLLGITLEDGVYEGEIVRLSFTTGDGTVLSSDIVEVENGSYIEYALPQVLTIAAGQLCVRVVLSKLENGVETETFRSGEAVLWFDEASVENGTPFWTGVSQMLARTVTAKEVAVAAQEAAQTAEKAATAARDEAVNAQNAVQETINNSSVLRYKGRIPSGTSLITLENTVGDVWYIENETRFYVWDGEAWKPLAAGTDGVGIKDIALSETLSNDTQLLKSIYEITLTDGNTYEFEVNHGRNGTNGHTPEKGADYFTDEDIGDIVNAVYAKVANGNEVAY